MSQYGENDYKVYMHVNPHNGKKYVGCTKKSLKARFDNGNGYKKCGRFFKDIVKYGFDNFEHILVSDGLSKEEAYELEKELIQKYDTMNPEKGYNMRPGGHGGKPCAEVNRHISEAKMGHEVTAETRAKLSKYGCKPVVQLTLDGFYVARYDSMTEASEKYGVAKACISSVCRGIKPTCKGFKWVYAEQYK